MNRVKKKAQSRQPHRFSLQGYVKLADRARKLMFERTALIQAAIAGIMALIAIPFAASGHGSVLIEPQWCKEQTQPAANGIPPPGTFPGPANHYKVTNMELGSFDLAREIPALAGRNVRARFWLMEPGGVIAEHCHADRPAFVYLLQGEVVETIEIDGKPVKRILKAGQSIPEKNGTRHWWMNNSAVNVLMVAIDIPNSNHPAPKNPTFAETRKVETRQLNNLLLKEQYPHIPDVANYKLQGRIVTFQPDGQIGLDYHAGRPGIAYVIEGMLLEHRSDQDGPIVRRSGDISIISNGIWNRWENKSQGNATLLVVEFEDCGECQK